MSKDREDLLGNYYVPATMVASFRVLGEMVAIARNLEGDQQKALLEAAHKFASDMWRGSTEIY